jgi:hypothetical protein
LQAYRRFLPWLATRPVDRLSISSKNSTLSNVNCQGLRGTSRRPIPIRTPRLYLQINATGGRCQARGTKARSWTTAQGYGCQTGHLRRLPRLVRFSKMSERPGSPRWCYAPRLSATVPTRSGPPTEPCPSTSYRLSEPCGSIRTPPHRLNAWRAISRKAAAPTRPRAPHAEQRSS